MQVRVLCGGRLHVQAIPRGSARPDSVHGLMQPVRRGWGSRADMLGIGQGCSVGKLILTHHFLFFRCLAAVPDLEGTRHSLVVLTPLKFWGICTLFQDFAHSPSCCCSVPLEERGLGALLDKTRYRWRDGSMEMFAQCPGAAQQAN